MNYAVQAAAEPRETKVEVDVEISRRDYIATAIVTEYDDVEDVHVEWLSVREPMRREPVSFEDERWRDALLDQRNLAIEAARG